MKTSRISLVLIVSVLAALLLSSCTGGSIYNTWPGISAKDGIVYVSYTNGVFAVKDGNMLWRFPEKAENDKAFYAPPTFIQDVMIAADYTNNVFGVNPQNGNQAWISPMTQDNGGHFVAGPVVIGDTILAPSSDHNLYALDLAGNLRWKYRTGNILWGQPVSDGTVVYLPAMDHHLYALKLADGSLLWKKDLGFALPSAPVLDEGGGLYVANLSGDVFAIDPARGDIRWQVDLEGEVWSTPLVVKDILYVGSSNGKVYQISVTGRKIAGETTLGSPVIGGGVQYGENIVFPTEGGGLFAINSQGQATSWKPTVNGKLYTTPVVVEDHVVVAVKDGEQILSAFDKNGTEVWSFTVPK
jgi:eukaryotic-like serine/threonine-protein kinase